MMEALLKHKAAVGRYPGQVLASSDLFSTSRLYFNNMMLPVIECIQLRNIEAYLCFVLQVAGGLAPQNLQTQLR